MKVETLYAYADAGNENSRKILEKLGFHFVNSFEYNEELEVWYELKNRTHYKKRIPNLYILKSQ